MKRMDAQALATRRYEGQKPNHFEVVIAGFGDDLMFAVKSFPLATRSNEVIEMPYGNSKQKLAGTTSFGSGDLVVRDFMEADTEKQLEAWQNQIHDLDTGKAGYKYDSADGASKGYARKATVFEYSPDGEFKRSWELIGVWPSSVNYGELSHENGNAVKDITVTLEYDMAKRID